jgi:predicted NAD/FAD-dependent oxidoreductase
VIVLDKARSPGGRMATRRIEGASLDHGAQFFTTRSADFSAAVAGWVADGRARVWSQGFKAPEDGHPRYAGAGGMNALCRSLLDGLDVRGHVPVAAVGPGPGGRWLVQGAGVRIEADGVVLTPPLPQAVALLEAGGLDVPDEVRSVGYEPCLAALAVLDRPLDLSPSGGLQPDGGPFGFVADNQAKGISPRPAITMHAIPEVSRARWELPDTEALASLLADGAAYLADAEVVAAELKRWRYAGPATTLDGGCFQVARDLVVAGDAFHGAKVEGAWLSGRDAADHLGTA